MVESVFGVAFRNGHELFLYFLLKRGNRGEVYYALPAATDQKSDWIYHGSHHASGETHHVSDNYQFFMRDQDRKRQKPDPGFRGVEHIITRPVASDEPRAVGRICDVSRFSAILEVPVEVLSPKKYETYIAADLTDPDSRPTFGEKSRILAQRAFNDSVPWIWVTVLRRSHDDS